MMKYLLKIGITMVAALGFLVLSPMEVDARSSLSKAPRPTAEAVHTPIGRNAVVKFPVNGISILFRRVTRAGTTSLSVMSDPPAPPPGYKFIGDVIDINTTTMYNKREGLIVAVPWCGNCMPNSVPWCGNCSSQELGSLLNLMHHEGGVWKNITTDVDIANDMISGETSSLSPLGVILLIDQVAATKGLIALVSGMELNGEIDNRLVAKLNNALSVLTDDVAKNDAAAANELTAFIKECKAQMRRHLSVEQAKLLISRASMIIQTLQRP